MAEAGGWKQGICNCCGDCGICEESLLSFFNLKKTKTNLVFSHRAIQWKGHCFGCKFNHIQKFGR